MINIKETSITDRRGNVVISGGLKVRHKKSKFEYTVDSVVQDKTGKVIVLLKKPEESRFSQKDMPGRKETLTGEGSRGMSYEADPIDDFSTSYYSPEEGDESPEDLIAVPAQEFEKEYEPS